jgi:hypothetical protein
MSNQAQMQQNNRENWLMSAKETIKAAFETASIEYFMRLIFPFRWKGIAARIVESGAEFRPHEGPTAWAPRWSAIPRIVRTGKTELETHVKSCIFRAHDCLHQLWGLPIPRSFDDDEFYLYKRAQMCGEVAVLTLIEFGLCANLAERFPELREIAARLDDLLHKKRRPKWVRDSAVATAFCDDYVPMLEADRHDIDHNWAVMKNLNWRPQGAPNARYGRNLDGLELTLWMIDDFELLMHTDAWDDIELTAFNRSRRKNILLPMNWHANPQR